MSYDFGHVEFRKNQNDSSGERRVYVCECGNVRIEEKHFRYTFAPEEFVQLLRQLSPEKICQIGKSQSDFPSLVKIAGRLFCCSEWREYLSHFARRTGSETSLR